MNIQRASSDNWYVLYVAYSVSLDKGSHILEHK